MRILQNLTPLTLLVLTVIAPINALSDFRDAEQALKKKDYGAASLEFRKLAELGHADASFAFAQMLNQELATDPLSAQSWYALSAAQGHTKAIEIVSKINQGLTNEQAQALQEQHDLLIGKFGPAALQSSLMPTQGRINNKVFERGTILRVKNWANLTVDLEMDIDMDGRPRDFQLMRETPEAYVDWTLHELRLMPTRAPKQKAKDGNKQDPAMPRSWSSSLRVIFYRDENPEQYGDARMLRKLHRRAKNGSPYRKYYYAFAQELAHDLGNVHTPGDALDWYLIAAQGGHAEAQYVVGKRFLMGAFGDQETEKGYRWIEEAAERGDAHASYLMARRSESTGSDTTAAKMREAAELGHSTAQLWYARFSSANGQTQEARAWLQKAENHLDRATWFYTKATIERAANNKSWVDSLAKAEKSGKDDNLGPTFFALLQQVRERGNLANPNPP